MIPIPRPEMKRSIANSVTEPLLAIQLTPSMLSPTKNIAATNSALRPNRSDNGARPAAPIAIPKSAELNSEPSAERSSPHDTATLGAVTDIATTSIPSARFSRKPRKTTSHMSGTVGPASIRALTNSALMVSPSSGLRPLIAPKKRAPTQQPIDSLDNKTKRASLSADGT